MRAKSSVGGRGRKRAKTKKAKVRGTTHTPAFKFERESVRVLSLALAELEKGFAEYPPVPSGDGNNRAFESVIGEVSERLKDNYPYFHPLYAGQMLKPPHPIARAAYMLSMWINPNNHALDGGRASSAMEKEAVAEIARMFGWQAHLGHLTGGGTMANLEALWVAGQLSPGRKVLASDQAHYTHSRISSVLGLEFESVPSGKDGRMDTAALQKLLDAGDVGTVVATVGTTGMGAVDPLPLLLDLREKYGFRLHVDAAYGGYFTLADNLDNGTRASFDRMSEVDSVVVDPHKHGLQPYSCGCVVFHDPSVARFYKHDSPYTYFTSDQLHLGEISLECSRAGASAVALWATQRLLPLEKGGEFARSLAECRDAAIALHEKLGRDSRFITSVPPELDIVVWVPAAESVTNSSSLSRALFETAAKQNLHLALAELPVSIFDLSRADMTVDAGTITCLRSVLMKPEHKYWIERIWRIIDDSMRKIKSR